LEAEKERMNPTDQTSLWLRSFCVGVSFIILSACAQTGTHPTRYSIPEDDLSKGQASDYGAVQGPFGHSGESDNFNQEPDYGPSPSLITPIVLVFGAGGARAYSYAGVLIGLLDAKIPLGAITATGMGALIAALYASSQTINEFEWKLLQFDEKVFSSQRSFFSSFRESSPDPAILERRLIDVFGDTRLEDLNLPVKILLQDIGTQEIILYEKGSIRQLVRAALSGEETFPAPRLNGRQLQSAEKVSAFPTKNAYDLEIGPVIVVDVREQKKVISDLREASLVLEPNLMSLNQQAYEKRSIAIFQGKNIVSENLTELRALTGTAYLENTQ
jgi:predicted acylesterase/phospholipase RssA